jgi:response regulator RpfG family c-di-GMP phosphodiesterase
MWIMSKEASTAVRALNVLIVDDYQDTAETTAMTLRLCGDTVTTANDGESALQAVTAMAGCRSPGPGTTGHERV